ncbi:MAG: hypothetical protein ABSE73_30575 [Planctomycetota bacterium]
MRRWLGVGRPMRLLVAALLGALLAGYLIFNKPFAKLGVGQFYVGEMVLACVLLSLLGRLDEVFVRPCRRSWTFRLIALFWLYGVVRALTGYTEHGCWALRDSVVATYSLAAFLAPAVWGDLVPPRDWHGSQFGKMQELPGRLLLWLLPVATLGALWTADVFFGWTMQSLWVGESKADFLALAVAVAAWLWAVTALRAAPWQQGGRGDAGTRTAACAGAAVLAVEAFLLVKALPTRTVWLVLGPLAALTAAAWASTPARRRICLAAGLGLVCAAAFKLRDLPRSFGEFDRRFELAQVMEFSSDGLEVWLRQHPERYPRLALTKAIAGGEKAEKERWQSLMTPDESQFETEAGQRGAHAVEWRAVFWLRCWHYVLHRAPVLGVGFGTNLVNLLRFTPAWPIYIDNLRLDPPNRTPHCAHVNIFARLGLLGLALWLAILALVLWGAMRTLWCYDRFAASGLFPPEKAAACRLRFWDGLAILGVWVIYLWAMTFGVVLEGPIGGIWFWALTGVLAWWSPVEPEPTATELKIEN